MPDQAEAPSETGATATEASSETDATAADSGRRISPWWLLAAAIATGAALTAVADLISGSAKLSAVEWLGTTATVAALVIAVGIYRLQEHSGSEAHAELMDQLEAQNELLNDFAKRADVKADEPKEPDTLSPDQRAEIESRYGRDSIATAIDPGRGRGGRGGARLVRLNDGRLVSVYDRRGRTYVREIPERGERGNPRQDGRPSPRR